MHLTNIVDAYIPFIIIPLKGVGPSSGFKMLFQNEDFLTLFG